jgi:hypothetical protein
MARTVMITDDLDGSPDAEPVRFMWDEVLWELDLSEPNRAKLAEALQPYLAKAHPAQVAAAETVRRTRAPRGTRAPEAERVDYTAPEHAGEPHRGRVSPEEAAFVRDNLELVNRRLLAEGLRVIDPSNAKMAERYGL